MRPSTNPDSRKAGHVFTNSSKTPSFDSQPVPEPMPPVSPPISIFHRPSFVVGILALIGQAIRQLDAVPRPPGVL